MSIALGFSFYFGLGSLFSYASGFHSISSLSVFALPGSGSIEIDVGSVALPARIFFRSSVGSLHGTSISIDRRFMATEGRRR